MVPDRAILPLSVGLMGGFTVGMIDSILQKQGDPVITLAVIGAVAAGVAGAASVVGVHGRHKASVAILRAFYGAALFLCVNFAIQAFMHSADFLLMLVLLIGAAISAIMLALPRADTEPERREHPTGTPQPTA
jgi:hypothetical protein